MTAEFVHLRLHTEYSLVDGLVRIKPLMQAAAELGLPAVALTDQSNMMAMVRFYKAAMASGVKPILGMEARLRSDGEREKSHELVLLCQDETGFGNLKVLSSEGYLKGQHGGRVTLERDWLTPQSCEGLIALSGGREGDIGRALLAGKHDLARELAEGWKALFPGRFYIELQRTGRENEEDYLHAAVALAAECDLPVVATNDVRFIRPEDFEAHEVRVCIHDSRVLDDPRREKRYSREQYLRSPEEMAELFADIPEALQNSVEIAKRCNVELTLGKNYLPDFPVPEGMTMDEFFRSESHKGLEWRLEALLDKNDPDYEAKRRPYVERLDLELDVIIQMGFPGYFLIVADFIQWAKDNGIPVGPGRGSGAGSLVAYALKITDLDPLAYDLLFERFLNPERVSMPDFDVDFCMDNRDRVIDYVARKYGRESVSQIITFGTMAAKAVVRDVGRVLGHPYGFVDRIAKLIPPDLGMTLDKALEQEPDLKKWYDQDEEVRDVLDMGRALEGVARNAGKHAGGVVIAPGKLTDFAPLYCEEGGDSLVTQLDKDDVEQAGLVKFDFLGLRTLTIIDWAVKTVNGRKAAAGEEPVDINTIPLDDKASFDLLKAAETTAVFQLESRGMKELIKKLQPDCFEDIVALVALFRPGPLQSGMVDDFINRKHGRAEVSYPDPKYQHELLKPILAPTYGIILYQEQVMQIAQAMAKYTLGGADMLRRAMGKKKAEVMAEQRAIFMEGAQANNIDPDLAGHIFDLMEKFAGYGFNKSHSAAYALVSFQTAWMKAHYPAAFMAAVLSADMDNTDKVVGLIEECRRMQLAVVPPDVNRSQYKFTIADDATVVYGLGAIKGVGEGPIAAIVEAREAGGPFKDLNDFCIRVGTARINRRVLEALIRAGALDQLGPNRASLFEHLPEAIRMAEQEQANASQGMDDLFGMSSPEAATPILIREIPEWDDDVRLGGEKETLGLYLTGHPIDRYRREISRFVSGDLASIADRVEVPSAEQEGYRRNETDAIVAGLIINLRTRLTQKGEKEAFVTLDDGTGRVEVRIFPEDFIKYQNLLGKEQVLVVDGGASFDSFSGGVRMRMRRIFDIEAAREAFAREIRVRVDGQTVNGGLQGLKGLLEPFREGGLPIVMRYQNGQARAYLRFGEAWRVRPGDELLKRLGEAFGQDRVSIHYPS